MRSTSALDLPLPAAFEETEMHVEAMEDRRALGQLDLAVQHAAALERVGGDVLVLLRDDRIARQHRVAVVAVAVDRIAAVRHLAPHRVGDELVLRFARPVEVAPGVAVVDALHLLQEQDVRRQAVQLFVELVDHHPTREMGKALVDVVGGDAELHWCCEARKSNPSMVTVIVASHALGACR